MIELTLISARIYLGGFPLKNSGTFLAAPTQQGICINGKFVPSLTSNIFSAAEQELFWILKF